MIIHLVPVHDVDRVWPHVAGLVNLATQRQNHNWTCGEFHVLCRSGSGFLFVRDDGAALAIATFHQEKGVPVAFIELMAAAPKIKGWRRGMYERVCAEARDHGCKAIVGEGREFFDKIFPGAKVYSVRYKVEIDHA